MEHIRQFDWFSTHQDPVNFVDEYDIDNCVTEKILRNKFKDPLFSSESETESEKPVINWDDVFSQQKSVKNKIYVPGLRAVPPFNKVSALSKQQHFKCLKVLCAQSPSILQLEFFPKPNMGDFKVYEEIKDLYEKEQKEFIDWAKTLWASTHCVKALRPKPAVEICYEAEFKVRAKMMESYPKLFKMAAQIPLTLTKHKFEMVHLENVINVDISNLPEIKHYEILVKRLTVLRPPTVPEPCTKHPCRFILPNEDSMTVLPTTEVHRALCEFGESVNARCVSSLGALRCLADEQRSWALPVRVLALEDSDGDKRNIFLLGSEFNLSREDAQTRTHKAMCHLIESAFIPPSEKYRVINNSKLAKSKISNEYEDSTNNYDMDVSSDDDENLTIDDANNFLLKEDLDSESDDIIRLEIEPDSHITPKVEILDQTETAKEDKASDRDTVNVNENITPSVRNDEDTFGVYNCTCKETAFANPPPRSYKKWQIRNVETSEKIDLLVHCPHKVRNDTGEVILEPIIEYQLELGGATISRSRIKALALEMYLKQNASLVTVRIDSVHGEVVRIDSMTSDEFNKIHGDVLQEVWGTIHMALTQLEGLLPGSYILVHEPSHGFNALLYTPTTIPTQESLLLDFNLKRANEVDEYKALKSAPVLDTVLLPVHKLRKILPCAFTPYENQIAREPRKPVTRNKTPPKAIKDADVKNGTRRQWPKKKSKKKKSL